ncbi:nSTAND1 domain-containing NTPase [Streptomyces sp. Tue6028]|uniref:helix-turn-helix domain-containing protein n=1 Tax=Streptomyces sp. Tue6028 TaxID=2036037 RepID=UPI003EB81087
MGRREKPLDPADGTVPAFAHELRKLRADAGTPTYRAMARRAGYSGPTLSAAASGERLPTLAVLLAYVTACGGDTAEWEKRWHEAAAERADAPGQDGADSPYPGLARFEPADHDRFHGRDDLIAELLALTGRARFSAIVGASGSGKSSLLRAGLIPALRQETSGAAVSPGTGREEAGAPGSPGVPPGGGRGLPRPSLVPAAIRILTPGAHPDQTPDALFVPHDAPGDTLLVVDQFEEVFTLCADPGERARFIDRLLTALEPDSGLRVIIGVRADFYGRCADHGRLAEALRESTLLVGPMTPQRLREAVVRPAAARRVVVERALTARIVADVTGEPGGLPLMAHALRETWRRRSARTLTLAAYESVGGVQGAVAHTAEEVYGRCTPAEAVAVRALLLRLVHPGDGAEDTRRPVRRDELGDTAPTGRLLERLVAARLLTVDGDTVELAHEALISAWPRLHGWLDEDRERLRTHRRLTEAAGVWKELGRERGALYRGVRLTEAREEFSTRQGELSTLERDFLAASVAAYEHGRRAAARAARRLRALTAGLAVLLCLAVVAGVFAWRQSGVSERQRDEAEARRVAAFADTLRPTDPRTAMRLALAA